MWLCHFRLIHDIYTTWKLPFKTGMFKWVKIIFKVKWFTWIGWVVFYNISFIFSNKTLDVELKQYCLMWTVAGIYKEVESEDELIMLLEPEPQFSSSSAGASSPSRTLSYASHSCRQKHTSIRVKFIDEIWGFVLLWYSKKKTSCSVYTSRNFWGLEIKCKKLQFQMWIDPHRLPC